MVFLSVGCVTNRHKFLFPYLLMRVIGLWWIILRVILIVFIAGMRIKRKFSDRRCWVILAFGIMALGRCLRPRSSPIESLPLDVFLILVEGLD